MLQLASLLQNLLIFNFLSKIGVMNKMNEVKYNICGICGTILYLPKYLENDLKVGDNLLIQRGKRCENCKKKLPSEKYPNDRD